MMGSASFRELELLWQRTDNDSPSVGKFAQQTVNHLNDSVNDGKWRLDPEQDMEVKVSASCTVAVLQR